MLPPEHLEAMDDEAVIRAVEGVCRHFVQFSEAMRRMVEHMGEAFAKLGKALGPVIAEIRALEVAERERAEEARITQEDAHTERVRAGG